MRWGESVFSISVNAAGVESKGREGGGERDWRGTRSVTLTCFGESVRVCEGKGV
jgi:hypothetical protein